uniref:Uncharacterized protein n=1 Tax=Ditylenchus dipsaci TaxID=166011 RepID=A0A915DQ79_9BILA
MSLKIRLFMFILLKLSTITTEQKNEQSILDLRDFQDTSSDGEILNYRSGQPSETDILESPPIYESDPYDKEQPDNFSKQIYLSNLATQLMRKINLVLPQLNSDLSVLKFVKKSNNFLKNSSKDANPKTEEAKKCLQRDEQGALVFDVCKDEDSQEQDLSPEKQPAKQPKPPISIDSTPVQDEFLNSNEDLETFSTPTFEESVEASELSTQDEQEQDSLAEEAELSSRSPEQSSQSEDSSVVIEKKVTKKKKKGRRKKQRNRKTT